MKRKMLFIVIVFMLFLCSGCTGTITRSIRHSGFTIAGDFACDPFFPKDKDDTSYSKVKFLTGTHIISNEGKLYEVSLEKPYASNSNCKEADTTISVVSIFDNKIVRAADGKMYYLNGDNSTTPYSEVTGDDNNYAIYQLLLGQESTIKVITAGSSGLYYVLKNDGNVYSYTVNNSDRGVPPTITSTELIYNKDDYGSENIIDFNYAGENSSTFIRTDNKAYKMFVTNAKECNKYADVACKYQMNEFTIYSEYKDYFIAYNGSKIITSYGKIFNVEN